MYSVPVITLDQYLRGRGPISQELETNALALLSKVNNLLVELEGHVDFDIYPVTNTIVSSGYRTAAVNASTPGAAPKSKHIQCLAIDIYDPDGDIDDYLTDAILEKYDLYREHPAATKGWCHLQSVPPNSKKRTFYP
jgi:hypothetical protein